LTERLEQAFHHPRLQHSTNYLVFSAITANDESTIFTKELTVVLNSAEEKPMPRMADRGTQYTVNEDQKLLMTYEFLLRHYKVFFLPIHLDIVFSFVRVK